MFSLNSVSIFYHFSSAYFFTVVWPIFYYLSNIYVFNDHHFKMLIWFLNSPLVDNGLRFLLITVYTILIMFLMITTIVIMFFMISIIRCLSGFWTHPWWTIVFVCGTVQWHVYTVQCHFTLRSASTSAYIQYMYVCTGAIHQCTHTCTWLDMVSKIGHIRLLLPRWQILNRQRFDGALPA